MLVMSLHLDNKPTKFPKHLPTSVYFGLSGLIGAAGTACFALCNYTPFFALRAELEQRGMIFERARQMNYIRLSGKGVTKQ